jgi:hypothetical protein
MNPRSHAGKDLTIRRFAGVSSSPRPRSVFLVVVLGLLIYWLLTVPGDFFI